METQAKAAFNRRLDDSDFADKNCTVVYWLGVAGILINCHGTTILIDPAISYEDESRNISEVFHKPYLQRPPISPAEIKKADFILYSHADEDHMGSISPKALEHTGAMYHGTRYVANELINRGVASERVVAHNKNDVFYLHDIMVQMTSAQHPWQLLRPEIYGGWHYGPEDCCGYLIHTPEGVIWHPGDTQLLDEHFGYDCIELMFVDFSDDKYHFGPKDSLKLINHYKDAKLIPYHWGTFDAPDDPAANSDPYKYVNEIASGGRFSVIGFGQPYVLEKQKI